MLDNLRLDPRDERAGAPAGRNEARPCDPSSRKATDGDAEVSGEFKFGHIKVGPSEADAWVGHGTDRSRNG
jgi:hypothetical protein